MTLLPSRQLNSVQKSLLVMFSWGFPTKISAKIDRVNALLDRMKGVDEPTPLSRARIGGWYGVQKSLNHPFSHLGGGGGAFEYYPFASSLVTAGIVGNSHWPFSIIGFAAEQLISRHHGISFRWASFVPLETYPKFRLPPNRLPFEIGFIWEPARSRLKEGRIIKDLAVRAECERITLNSLEISSVATEASFSSQTPLGFIRNFQIFFDHFFNFLGKRGRDQTHRIFSLEVDLLTRFLGYLMQSYSEVTDWDWKPKFNLSLDCSSKKGKLIVPHGSLVVGLEFKPRTRGTESSLDLLDLICLHPLIERAVPPPNRPRLNPTAEQPRGVDLPCGSNLFCRSESVIPGRSGSAPVVPTFSDPLVPETDSSGVGTLLPNANQGRDHPEISLIQSTPPQGGFELLGSPYDAPHDAREAEIIYHSPNLLNTEINSYLEQNTYDPPYYPNTSFEPTQPVPPGEALDSYETGTVGSAQTARPVPEGTQAPTLGLEDWICSPNDFITHPAHFIKTLKHTPSAPIECLQQGGGMVIDPNNAGLLEYEGKLKEATKRAEELFSLLAGADERGKRDWLQNIMPKIEIENALTTEEKEEIRKAQELLLQNPYAPQNPYPLTPELKFLNLLLRRFDNGQFEVSQSSASGYELTLERYELALNHVALQLLLLWPNKEEYVKEKMLGRPLEVYQSRYTGYTGDRGGRGCTAKQAFSQGVEGILFLAPQHIYWKDPRCRKLMAELCGQLDARLFAERTSGEISNINDFFSMTGVDLNHYYHKIIARKTFDFLNTLLASLKETNPVAAKKIAKAIKYGTTVNGDAAQIPFSAVEREKSNYSQEERQGAETLKKLLDALTEGPNPQRNRRRS